MLMYLVKLNLAVAALYVFYRLVYGRDTFFRWRRVTLLGICGFAALVPLLGMPSAWWQAAPGVYGVAATYATVVLPTVTAYAVEDDGLVWTTVAWGLYWAGVGVLGLRLLGRVVSICRLARRSEVREVDGCRVHLLPGEGGPFSFFRWIFVYESLLDDARLAEVLQHERVHASQGHSCDVLVIELYTVLCWINPLVWHMRREVRENLEFLADEGVLAEGNARKAYQYHLLGLACHSGRWVPIANSFNVLPLKKRIMMMNKRRTHEVAKVKYLFFVPLAGVMLVISNVETVARGIAGRMIPSADEVVWETGAVWQNPVEKPMKKASAKAVAKAVPATSPTDDKVYDVVEVMPQFPGGLSEMMKFVSDNIRYPVEAQKKNIEGRVVVSFVVRTDGSVSDVKVQRGVDPSLDAEAVRVVKSMPLWTPGKQGGEAVNVSFTMPLAFRLAVSSSDDKKVCGGVPVIPATKASPLVLVDGVEVPSMDQVDVDKIETISVVTSGDAKIRYGEKGKNGVLLVTTKK